MIPAIHSPYTLPAITSITGFGAFAVGVYAFLRPLSAATVYGIPAPVTEQTSSKLSSELRSTEPRPLTPEQKVHLAFVQAHSIRYVSMGASVMVLSYFYVAQSFPALVRRCLGIVLLFGSLTPLEDTLITRSMGPDVGRRPLVTHAMRVLTWVGVGVTCLW